MDTFTATASTLAKRNERQQFRYRALEDFVHVFAISLDLLEF